MIYKKNNSIEFNIVFKSNISLKSLIYQQGNYTRFCFTLIFKFSTIFYMTFNIQILKILHKFLMYIKYLHFFNVTLDV